MFTVNAWETRSPASFLNTGSMYITRVGALVSNRTVTVVDALLPTSSMASMVNSFRPSRRSTGIWKLPWSSTWMSTGITSPASSSKTSV